MKKAKVVHKNTGLRQFKVSFLLNSEELKAMNHYLNKYKIDNRSHYLRETLLSQVLQKLDEDYPTLFEPWEMKG
ncbi:MAG: hypothetical protein PHI48_01525 [Bacteroidales bacterium]|nr:hypothetical protein [Bacteroidales bacterium]MDD4821228.1 hypothetical protein [Bacteroidales bacterium]